MAPQRWTNGERLDGIFWHLCERDLPNTRWMIVRADDPSAVSWYMEAKISPSFNPQCAGKEVLHYKDRWLRYLARGRGQTENAMIRGAGEPQS
jgi:hypothetical protein